MNKKNDDFIRQLQEEFATASEKITLPESLSTQSIVQMLEESQQTSTESTNKKEPTPESIPSDDKKKGKIISLRRVLVAAAAFALIMTAALPLVANRLHSQTETTTKVGWSDSHLSNSALSGELNKISQEEIINDIYDFLPDENTSQSAPSADKSTDHPVKPTKPTKPAQTPEKPSINIIEDSSQQADAGSHIPDSSGEKPVTITSSSDTVKFYGEYIYIANTQTDSTGTTSNTARLVKAVPAAALESVKTITDVFRKGEKVCDLIVNDTTLAVVTEFTAGGKDKTGVYIYDTADKLNPALETTVVQDGCYVSAKIIAKRLHVITVYDADPTLNENELLPTCFVNNALVSFGENWYSDEKKNSKPRFLVVTSVSLQNSEDSTSLAYYGGGSDLYFSAEELILTRTITDAGRTSTGLFRFAIDENGVISDNPCQGEIAGTLLSNSVISKSGGYRYLLTNADNKNYLWALDSELNAAPVTVAEGNTVSTIKFVKNTAYIVCKENGKLFVATLGSSDTAIKDISNKVTVSHFTGTLTVADNCLICVSGTKNSTKISLYDISDSDEPTLLDTYTEFGECASPAVTDSTAICMNSSKTVFGLPVTFTRGTTLACFDITGGKLTPVYDPTSSKAYISKNIRGVFVNSGESDVLYIISNTGITAFSTTDGKDAGHVDFTAG